jgi:hypothetical protein
LPLWLVYWMLKSVNCYLSMELLLVSSYATVSQSLFI